MRLRRDKELAGLAERPAAAPAVLLAATWEPLWRWAEGLRFERPRRSVGRIVVAFLAACLVMSG